VIRDHSQRDLLGARTRGNDANLVAPETEQSAALRGCGEAEGIAVIDPPVDLAVALGTECGDAPWLIADCFLSGGLTMQRPHWP
jgi:hypothetical protein